MRDLLGRLTSLDPQASDTLKIVGYFDALSSRGVGLGGLLRAAAVLAGVNSGAELNGTVSVYDPSGRRVSPVADAHRSAEVVFGSGSVWLEREGEPHAGDGMITERLALAVESVQSRRRPTSATETVIDSDCPTADRISALLRLGMAADTRIRVIVSAGAFTSAGEEAVPVATRYGVVSVGIFSRVTDPEGPRRGLGTWVAAEDAPDSWAAGLIAFRLADADNPVVDASDMGVMLLLAQSYDPDRPHGDVAALEALDPVSREILRSLVSYESIRSAANNLAMHHSTLQARHESLSRKLGFDPRTANGRMRVGAAELLRRLV